MGESVAGGGCRRDVLRLIEVLHAGPATPVDLWIERRGEPASGHGLLLGLGELGLVRVQDRRIDVTPLGRFFIRNICMVFDPYLKKAGDKPTFSRTV